MILYNYEDMSPIGREVTLEGSPSITYTVINYEMVRNQVYAKISDGTKIKICGRGEGCDYLDDTEEQLDELLKKFM